MFLPSELWFLIFLFLPSQILRELRLVEKSWFRLIEKILLARPIKTSRKSMAQTLLLRNYQAVHLSPKQKKWRTNISDYSQSCHFLHLSGGRLQKKDFQVLEPCRGLFIQECLFPRSLTWYPALKSLTFFPILRGQTQLEFIGIPEITLNGYEVHTEHAHTIQIRDCQLFRYTHRQWSEVEKLTLTFDLCEWDWQITEFRKSPPDK